MASCSVSPGRDWSSHNTAVLAPEGLTVQSGAELWAGITCAVTNPTLGHTWIPAALEAEAGGLQVQQHRQLGNILAPFLKKYK